MAIEPIQPAKKALRWNCRETMTGKIGAKYLFLKTESHVRVPVRIGLSNGGFTAIEGNVQEGQAVIIGLSSSSNSKQGGPDPSTPFGMQAPPGGGMGRMR
jgi:hypothetical protein